MNRKDLQARAERVRIHLADTERTLNAIEGARMQLSSAQDEIRGQTTVVKERIAWAIKELDAIRALIVAAMPASPQE